MKTNTKIKATVNTWVLKNKETGKVYSNWTYPSRNAARKAAKGRKFKGMYTPAKSGDGGIDPKKLKPTKPSPKPKSLQETRLELEEVEQLSFMRQLINALIGVDEVEQPVPSIEEQIESNTMTKVRKPVNTTPKLRKTSSAPGAKFHRHGTFGVRN